MRLTFLIFILLIGQWCFPQGNLLWKGYFSYNEIIDVEASSTAFFAATENGVFYKNTTQQDVNILNSVNGFKPNAITAIHYSESFKKTIAGDQNGLLLLANEDGTITTKVDIIEEIPVAPNKKKINDLYEHEGKLYIATDYGISVLNLNTLEFISTYFIGTSGEEVEVLQTTVLNEELFAVTRQSGIRKASLTNPFLYDYNQWQTFDSGYWLGIVTLNNQIVAMNTDGNTYRYNGSFQNILNQSQIGRKIKTNGNELIVTTQNNVFVLDAQGNQLAHITVIPDFDAQFTAAHVVNGQIFIGTEMNGVFTTTLSNPSLFENVTPNGPFRNNVFRVKKSPNQLWAVYGDYSREYNPYPLDELPTSKYSPNNGWINSSYEDLLQAKSICDLVINPNNSNQVYFTSYFSGIVKLDGADITLLNNTNTGPNGLESLILSPPNPNYVDIRINSPAFDKDNNLWVTNAFVERAIKVLRSNGQWQSYSVNGILSNYAIGRYGPMAIDKNNTKWIPAFNEGLVAFNDQMNNKFIVIDFDNSNLPDKIVNCVAVDNRNQVWIGTAKGLRILSSVDQFLSENELSTNPIIIQEGDLAQELFYQQPILDIRVDGANRKWVSIADAGVFLVSSNGQQILYRFTKANSPLPSDNVNDIEIDDVTGEVFFATDKGLVSFLGTSTKASGDLSNVYVYPNPVRPEFSGTVKIAGLTDKANVKITDIEGNLVYETTSEGGTIEWDTSAFGNYNVASGVYMIFIATQDGLDSTVKKVMLIR
ncbi:MAG: ABC transporter substrate-binding protein [Flavobacterium sp.]|uniref:type IX secretion system anionic LPS delivery protein PorZ n=1 Tax=Flavobacterium sp. TaxID=239 RepID=UPI000C62E706|nr:two-component regulator propeller domain-containing protein [Flavobacterium sp.]MBF02292.1 ABC transporter substrate-binding protein [Flavobacterium sp.]|tara:strand:- start:1427 stop:3712 length:2286 start_codon:yes stop_codon:yes gene_type:complete